MKIVTTEKAKNKTFDKKKLKRYWRKIYPKPYADSLVAKEDKEEKES